MHCLAEDVHPLLGRPASPRLARPGRYASESRSSGGGGGGAGHLCSDLHTIGGRRLPGKSGPTPTAKPAAHQTRRDPCACFVLRQCARAHFAGRCCCLPESASYFGEWQKGGGTLQAGADCRELQLANRTWQLRSVLLSNTQSKTQNCINSQTAHKLHNHAKS